MKQDYKVASPSGAAAAAGICHLLVLAGASGAGKSTFLEQLAGGSLSRDVRDRIPAGAENWMRLQSSGYKQWLPAITEAIRQKETPGIVLHYDMTRGAVLKGTYADDPVLGLLKMAQSITVITLAPASEQIAEQLLKRTLGSGTKPVMRMKRLLLAANRTVRRYLRDAVLAISPALPAGLTQRLKRSGSAVRAWQLLNKKGIGKIRRYEQSGWLEGVYQDWDAYLDSLAGEGAVIQRVSLAPDMVVSTGGLHGWRVVPFYRHG